MHCIFLGDSERTGTPADVHPAGMSGALGVERLRPRERMVNGRAAASGEKWIDLSEEIALFGDILNLDGVLVEIGPRLVFANSTVGGRQSPAGEVLRMTDLRWPGGWMGTVVRNGGE